MGKVSLKIKEKKDIFLYRTEIENLFISEFLPDAPGDYVKVFLFGLMYAQFNITPDRHEVCKLLGLSEEDMEEAWIYWESRGLVKIECERDENNEEVTGISFIRMTDELYGKAKEPETAPAPASSEEDIPLFVSIDDMDFDDMLSEKLVDKRLLEIYTKYEIMSSHTLSSTDRKYIEDLIQQYGVKADVFDFAIDYCADLGKFGINYIATVARRWTDQGCKTVDDARKLLERDSRRNSLYRQVFRALGFSRLPAPADREIMDRWFDELNCTIGEVLDACNATAGMRDPNLKYVNKVIENRRLEKGGVNTRTVRDDARSGKSPEVPAGGSPVSRKVLADYFEYIRATDDAAYKTRIDEVIHKVPEMKRVFEAESRVNAKMLSIRPGAENLDERQRLRDERIAIEDDRKKLLNANGFPADYLTRKYRCPVCRDTGYTDEGMVCSCCRERAAEAYKWHTEKEKA